ncbi:MAG: sulfotransferase domain-containing protein, partial [Thermoanaerobaculia bacterium]
KPHNEFARCLAETPPGAFVGPLYHWHLLTWSKRSQPTDRAVLVARDPRDQIVSWIFSLCYSHQSEREVDIFHELLLSFQEDRPRLALMCEHWRNFHPAFRSILSEAPLPPSVFFTRYEELVSKEVETFRRIADFLRWEVNGADLAKIVEAHSFSAQTGRRRGEEKIGSHLRKGTPGDWRHYFDATVGQFFETRYPGLLEGLGYETSSTWYQSLPERSRRSFAAL